MIRIAEKLAALLILLLLLPGCSKASVAESFPEKETDPLVLQKLEWFKDQKFGLFIHWGIYSQWGCIESWPLIEQTRWARPGDLKPWLERGKDLKRFSRDYMALNTTFDPHHFNPAKWAKAAKYAGMKYLVFTTKHHDGFAMFDTKQSAFSVTNPLCPFHINSKANIAEVLFDTFRKEDFGIGAYFSKSDLHHTDYWDPNWPHPSRSANYSPAQYPQKWARFVTYTHKQIEELMTDYGAIDILWLDSGNVRPPHFDINMSKIANLSRSHQPGLLVVDRTVSGRYENYRTPEQYVPEKPLPYPWETCMTIGDQWSYKPGDYYKSTRELIHLLVDIVAKGGNLLLNIGPDADGRLPEPALQRLKEIGDWMKINGEAIYRTRPIAPYKQGRVCLTSKAEAVYLIYLAKDGQTRPPKRITVSGIKPAENSKLKMLGSDKKLSWRTEKGQLVIDIPHTWDLPRYRHAWTIKISKIAK